jgi:toluene monooxygenase system ferredoxin subunit
MAFQTLCKTRYLGEGESTPFMLDGKEVLVLRPEGCQIREYPMRQGDGVYEVDLEG